MEIFKQKPLVIEKERNDLDFEKKLNSIKEFVKKIYEQSGASKEQIEKFNEHNVTILEYASELAKEEELTRDNLEALKIAASLHDVKKLDVPLVKHGFEGAKAAREKLEELGFDNEFIDKIANAIERHMGPIPGFMSKEAKKWEEENKEKIEFPRPETKIDQLLYDADMLSLIDQQGVEKILSIRKNIETFQKEDIETAQKEKITQKQAAWQSALKSAKEATDSLFTDSAKRKAEKLLVILEAQDILKGSKTFKRKEKNI